MNEFLNLFSKQSEYYSTFFSFSNEYNRCIYNTFVKAWHAFLKNPSSDPKIAQEKLRHTFDLALAENLKEPAFSKLLSNFINADTSIAESLKANYAYKAFADRYALFDKMTEPVHNIVNRTPSETIKMDGEFDLLHYKSKSVKFKTPLLVVGSIINREYILDMLPQVSVIKHFVDMGFDVYSTDWKTPSSISEKMELEDFCHQFLEMAIDKIKKITGVQNISLLGYCWGGIFSLIHASIHPENVKNLILHATPIDLKNDTSVVGIWTKNIDVGKLVQAFGSIPPTYLNFAFFLRNPVDALSRYAKFFSQPRNIDEINQFFAIEFWLYDSPPIVGKVFEQIINDIYKNNLLIQNKMKVGKDRTDLSKITMPVLNIIGEKDDLVPPQTSRTILEKIPSKDAKEIAFPTGHVGLCISKHAHEKLWPQVSSWLAQRS